MLRKQAKTRKLGLQRSDRYVKDPKLARLDDYNSRKKRLSADNRDDREERNLELKKSSLNFLIKKARQTKDFQTIMVGEGEERVVLSVEYDPSVRGVRKYPKDIYRPPKTENGYPLERYKVGPS